jgi:hypothetical protein
MRRSSLLLLLLGFHVVAGELEAQDRRAGLWVSEGYGLFLRIEPKEITASEITSRSC